MNRLRTVRTALFTLLAGLAPAGLLHAAERIEVIDLLPPTADRARAQTGLSEALGRDVALVPPAAELLEALRWSTPDPARKLCQSVAPELTDDITRLKRVPGPASSEELIPALLAQAEIQVRVLDLKEALTSLKQARDYLPCAPAVLTPAQVRSLFLSEALAHLYLWDGAQDAAFRAVLAVDPAYRPERSAPARIRETAKDASRALKDVEPLRLEPGDLPGAVYVDGRPLEPGLAVRPGRHVVQVKRGDEIRSALVTLEGDSPLRLSAMATLGLPATAELRERLSRSLLANEIDPVFSRVAEQHLATRAQQTLTFAIGGDEPTVRVFRAGLGHAGETSPGAEPARTPDPARATDGAP